MSKIEKRGKVSIIDDTFVYKEEDNLSELYNYLKSRDFNYFIEPIERENRQNKYPYVADYSLNRDQKIQDVTKVMALLHTKTSYNKEVSQDKFKALYDDLLGYINYLEEYYQKTLKDIEYKEFPSPSQTLFLSNYSKISEALFFDKNELEKWYGLVRNKTKERVSLNHGDIRSEHAISNDQTYLINWKKHSFDSPIVDLINFYHNEWNKVEFSSVLESYMKHSELTAEEKKLLFINITLPPIIECSNDEVVNVKKMRDFFDYLFKTEKLIGPYYTEQNEE